MVRFTNATVTAILALSFFAASTTTTSSAFVVPPPSTTSRQQSPMQRYASTIVAPDSETTTAIVDDVQVTESQEPPKPVVMKEKKVIKRGGKEGVFSPPVYFAKQVLGDSQLKDIRGKVISMHSDVIGKFVDTSETIFGNVALRTLFNMADINDDGKIDENELRDALQSLGFQWIQDKQANGIFSKADVDDSGYIDIDEFVTAAPKTLRTNLIKLAKKNGEEMGLLV